MRHYIHHLCNITCCCTSTTLKAIEGTDLHHNKHVLVSRNIEPDFINNIKKLLDTDDIKRKLVKNSKEYIKIYKKEMFEKRFQELFANIKNS